MYYPDLELYSYSMPFHLQNVFAVGWLDRAYSFTTGEVDARLVEKLKVMAIGQPALQSRGFSSCEICGREAVVIRHAGVERRLGSAEIWIPDASDAETTYASPDMIVHYVVDHGYQPPAAFLRSLEAVDYERWNGPRESERIIDEAFAGTR